MCYCTRIDYVQHCDRPLVNTSRLLAKSWSLGRKGGGMLGGGGDAPNACMLLFMTWGYATHFFLVSRPMNQEGTVERRHVWDAHQQQTLPAWTPRDFPNGAKQQQQQSKPRNTIVSQAILSEAHKTSCSRERHL